MTKEDLENIRAEFGLTLPSSYVEFLWNYPPELEAPKIDMGWREAPLLERYFLRSVDQILQLNRDVRFPGLSWLQDGTGWPSQLFVIGSDCSGNYYAIDTQAGSEVVYGYRRKLGSVLHQAATLREFAERVLADEVLTFQGKTEGNSPGSSAPPGAAAGEEYLRFTEQYQMHIDRYRNADIEDAPAVLLGLDRFLRSQWRIAYSLELLKFQIALVSALRSEVLSKLGQREAAAALMEDALRLLRQDAIAIDCALVTSGAVLKFLREMDSGRDIKWRRQYQ